MKIIVYLEAGTPHHKNYDGMTRMCKLYTINFELTHSLDRICEDNYDILWCNVNFVEPNKIPERIKIIYGPQMFIFPSGPIVGPLDTTLVGRCVYNTLSKWNEGIIRECVPELRMPIVQFPFPVDTERFVPTDINKTLDCIVYYKHRNPKLFQSVLQILQEKKISYKVFQYGSYKETEYLEALQQTKFMISIDAHESQGFALEEAMACNIPLLVLDASSMYDEMYSENAPVYSYQYPKKLLATSVPYWSNECGIKITTIEEFPKAFEYMLESYHIFTPRNYILDNLSDEVCMRRILTHFNIPIPEKHENSHT
jgi:glycosyltransferase involved in cell wall biosynthesis